MTAETTASLAADLGSNLNEDASPLPPLVPAGAAPSIEDQIAALNKQIAALVAISSNMLQAQAGAAALSKVPDAVLQEQAASSEMPVTSPHEKRVTIVLEDNDQIPPGGQFAQVDGRPFLLQAGYEMEAPVSLLDVLDHAVMSVPVTDENKNVIGYRDRLRFPYRVVRHRETEAQA